MKEWNFSNDTEHNESMNLFKDQVSKWEYNNDNNIGLLISGDLGVGKSYTAACIANALLEKFDATIVSENRGSDIFTIYAYSDLIEDSVISAGKKININISEEYDEVSNVTVIYFSTPLNNLDYQGNPL